MITVVAATWTLFIGIALMMLGNGLQGTLLGVRASMEGFATITTGLVMTGYFVGFLVGSLAVPGLVKKVGHIRVFAALASLASISVLVHAVFIDPLVWTVMRLVTGFSYAGLYIVAESWLNEQATNETRGRLLSVYMIVTLGGMACGQLLLNLSEPSGFKLFVLVSALVSLSLVPISLSVVSAPLISTPARVTLGQLYKASPLGVVGALGTGASQGALFGMGAVFATQLGLGVNQVAYFMTSAIVGGILFQWPIGWLSDRLDRRLVITAVTFAAASCALGVIVFSTAEARLFLFIAGAFFGAMNLPLYSLCIAHTNDHLAPEQMVAASGSLVLVTGIGASLGPLNASWLMSAIGPAGLFWALLLIHTLIGLFALYRMTRRASTPLREQTAYVPVTARASPIAAGLAAEETAGQLSDTQTRAGG